MEMWWTTTQFMLCQLSMSVKVIISSNCTYVGLFYDFAIFAVQKVNTSLFEALSSHCVTTTFQAR